MSKTKFMICGLVIGLSSTALADNPENMTVSLGGGVVGFTDPSTQDFASVGGAWEARFGLPVYGPFALEAAYVGSAQGIDALGMDANAILVGNGFEGNVRLDLSQGLIRPYVMGGVGFARYDITNTQFNTSDVADSDNMATFPVGVGVGTHYGRYVFDLRAQLRPVYGDEMIPAGNKPEPAGAHFDTWSTSLRVGFEF